MDKNEPQLNLCEKLTGQGVDRFKGKKFKIEPREFADGLKYCFESKDYDGVRFYRDSYVIGLSRWYSASSPEFIRETADKDLLLHAGFADLVNKQGYVSDEQLPFSPIDGPIAKFVKKALKPKHKTHESRYLFW